MKIQLSAIPGAYHLPRPNREAIDAWIDKHAPPADRAQAWNDVTWQWLETLRGALDRPHKLEPADDLLLLIPADFEHADSLVRLAVAGLAFVRDTLGEVAKTNWKGPLPVLVFAKPDIYYTYVSAFFPEGQFGGTAGICITRDHLHIAMYGDRP